jgi:hypothetical protein
MKTLPVKLYLSPYSHLKCEDIHKATLHDLAGLHIVADDANYTPDGYVLVGVGTVSFELIPLSDVIGGAVLMLSAKKQDIMSRAEVATRELDQRINEMLCLTHSTGG